MLCKQVHSVSTITICPVGVEPQYVCNTLYTKRNYTKKNNEVKLLKRSGITYMTLHPKLRLACFGNECALRFCALYRL